MAYLKLQHSFITIFLDYLAGYLTFNLQIGTNTEPKRTDFCQTGIRLNCKQLINNALLYFFNK